MVAAGVCAIVRARAADHFAANAQGKIVRETKVASEPEAPVAFFASLGFAVKRIGLEAGPLSPFAHFPHLYNFEQFRSLGAGTLGVQNCIGRFPGTLGS